ncbi:MAG: lamin tail domain-containing protein, partial [Caldilineaceae bacterium]|nr:lamin tail domain-containing protein [Caldilineaceae bacterium]
PQPWPGSAGDRGTPGSRFVAEAAPTPTAVPVLVPTATPQPPDSTTLPDAWSWSAAAGALQIDEVGFYGSDDEYVVLVNHSNAAVAAGEWVVGDTQVPGGGEGMYALPDELVLAPGARFVIARTEAAFTARFGQPPHAVFDDNSATVLQLQRRTDLAGGRFALKDSGDEVVLLTPQLEIADAVAHKNGDLAGLELTGTLTPPTGFALHRVPSVPPGLLDQRHHYLFAPGDPFNSLTLPGAASRPQETLEDGFIPVWGSLGARSNFSGGGTAPPRFVAAAAAASGLDFIAIADPAPGSLQASAEIAILSAWRWDADDEGQAIVYSAQVFAAPTLAELSAQLAEQGIAAQLLDGDPANAPAFTAVSAMAATAPGGLSSLFETWLAAGEPLAPAGNSNPPLPGRTSLTPRFTGLAASGSDPGAVMAALTARRAWVTSSPGLRLTLTAEQDGARQWMGSVVRPANQLTLHIRYRDQTGELAGLALWQDNRPIRQLETPAADEHWSITVPAVPGSMLFAVATQADGDFAVTTPIKIDASSAPPVVRISQVVPVPGADTNGDGQLTSDDEYIQLHNPGPEPVALAGWQLTDSRGDETLSARFTFGVGRHIGGGEYLTLWRPETGINLNNDRDYVRLLNAAGDEVDRIQWETPLEPGSTLTQNEETGEWQTSVNYNPPPYQGSPSAGSSSPGRSQEEAQERWEKWARGQADGPPGSVAAARYRGLERWVEFEGVVVVPPGLFNSAIYVADPAPDAAGRASGLGMQVYLWQGDYPALEEGDRVRVRGMTKSFRGEMEVTMDTPEQIWKLSDGVPLNPLAVAPGDIGEHVEGRFVTFEGIVTGWQSDSIYLGDPADPAVEPVRVTVRSSLEWRKPYVNKGERYRVTGVVSQFARAEPWNDGYRV